MFVNLKNVIEQVGKDKGLDKSILIDAMESALLTAAKKKYGSIKDIEAHYNEEIGEIELFQFREVVEDVTNQFLEVSLEEALKLDPEVEIGDSLGVKLDTSELGRIAAQTAKQVIIQKVKEAERDIVFNEYKERTGEIVAGIVQRFERGDIIVNLGRGEAILPKSEQIRRENYRQGDRIRAYILEVDQNTKGPQVILSRTRPEFLIKLFEIEVPEIYEKIVEVKGAAREPGERAKIAVVSRDRDVDPVGACVGIKGMRVQNVVQELKGEKIDIVLWEEDPAIYVCNALSPAQISKVVIDETGHSMEIIVPDDQLSLAIGKKGQNVRLAAKLVGWKIDIRNESDAKKKLDEECHVLANIPGVGDSMAQILHSHGFRTLVDLEKTNVDTLCKVTGLNKETAAGILNGARTLLSGEVELDKEASGVEDIPGVGKKTAQLLKEHGFNTLEDVAAANLDDLLQIKGLAAKKAESILSKAGEMFANSGRNTA